jgi:hypothetical protein
MMARSFRARHRSTIRCESTTQGRDTTD